MELEIPPIPPRLPEQTPTPHACVTEPIEGRKNLGVLLDVIFLFSNVLFR